MICPNCQIDAAISEQHYGALYNCSGCQAVYFINFEGQPEYGDVSFEAPVEVNNEVILPEVENVDNNENSLTNELSQNNMEYFDNKLEDQFQNQFNQLNTETIAPDYLNSDANSFEVTQTNEVFSDHANSFGAAAQNIADFGNMDVQIAGLNYDLVITGLDTQETVKLFKEAIEDSKFAWDATDIMKQLKNGKIHFEKLNPVKAYILAKRLQFLDIEKEWKQNVLA